MESSKFLGLRGTQGSTTSSKVVFQYFKYFLKLTLNSLTMSIGLDFVVDK